jgi:hypothetical protein
MRFLSLVCTVLAFVPDRVQSMAVGAKNKKRGASGGGAGAGFGANKITLTHAPDTSETTDKLVAFLKSQKSKGLEDVAIGFDEITLVRGLFALKDLKKGKPICQIPSNCALALSDPDLGGDDTPTPAHAGSNFLSMYWKNEQARTLWAPYLNTLPTRDSSQCDITPDFFSYDELELLEFPRLIRQAKERKEQISKLAAETGSDLAELQFATWLTSSRAFSISMATSDEEEKKEDVVFDDRGQVITKAGEQKTIRVMVPLIDMVNHSSDQPNAKLTLIDPEKDDAWFALEALRPIKAGKEIVIAYGSGVDSSSELFLNYGFVPQSNRIDEFMLKKGGDECIANLDDWTTTLEEDEAMLSMVEDDETLKKILTFRVKLKKSYAK